MANYLYTITSHNNDMTIGTPFGDSGVGAITSYDANSTQMVPSQTLLIEAPGTAYDGTAPGSAGNAQNPAATDRAIFTRVSNGGANNYGGTGPFFSVLIGDRDLSSVDTWQGLIGATGEIPWVGAGDPAPSLTWHTPFLGTDVFTLIVPTDNVVYESGTGRLGNVLVWHIPIENLGVYGQNANLPFRSTELPTAADDDTKAAAKILGMGFGLIDDRGRRLPYLIQA